MLRISKLTDYAVVLSSQLAAEGEATARGLAHATGIPEPTAGKVLKRLHRQGVVDSRRGARGGYRLARPAAEISVVEVIEALEGPISVTECSSNASPTHCEREGACDVQANWQRINQAVHSALCGISLADMAQPHRAQLVQVGLPTREGRAQTEQDEDDTRAAG